MTWARLDDRFHQNTKVLSLTDAEFRLYVIAITYCASERSTGLISRPALQALCRLHGLKPRAIDALVDKRCLDPDDEGFRVHDFLEYVSPDVRAARSSAGRKGAEARWHLPHDDHGRPVARAIGGAVAPAITGDDSRGNAPATPDPSTPEPPRSVPEISAGDTGVDESPAADVVRSLVTHFVDACVSLGADPIEEQRARVGRMAKKLLAAGKPAELIERAIGRMVERNRPPESLPYLIGEIERERSGKSPLPPLASVTRPTIGQLAERYASEAGT